MTEHQRRFPEFYVTSAQPCPYMPGRRERKLFTHLTHDKPLGMVDNLLRGGFRRSQNIAYMPYCDGCQACISVRVIAGEFEPGRSFKRTMQRNEDLVVRRRASRPTAEHYSLFRAYVESRHPGGGMADMTVLDFALMMEDGIIETFVSEYRLRPASAASDQAFEESAFEDWPLMAVALCDRLSDGLSMVYSFYDPDAADRSLGTFLILDQIGLTRAIGLKYVYLGYWIEASRKMSYKSRFQPQERLGPEGWTRVEP